MANDHNKQINNALREGSNKNVTNSMIWTYKKEGIYIADKKNDETKIVLNNRSIKMKVRWDDEVVKDIRGMGIIGWKEQKKNTESG